MSYRSCPWPSLSSLQLSIALLAFGCDDGPATVVPSPTAPSSVPTPDDTALPTVVDTGSAPPPTTLPDCVALALEPPGPVVVEMAGQIFLRALGGSGQPVFAVDPPEAGTITPTGLFTAGEVAGTAEVVLMDDGCTGEAVVALDIVPALSVAPTFARMLPSSTVGLAIEGGSGAYTCGLVGAAPGTLAGCSFTAGTVTGPAVIEVVDDVTATVVTATLVVDPDARLTTRSTVGWMAPVDSVFDPGITGGSGDWQLAAGAPAWLTTVPDPITGAPRLLATEAGDASVTIEDAIVPGLSLTRTVKALSPRVPPTHPAGALNENPRVIERDLDGDGLPELIVGEKDASIAAHRGGVVHVYAGTSTGFDLTTPIWSLEGEDDIGQLGASLALGDLDGDGLDDLVVGAPNVNWIANRVGEVSVFSGDGAGGFLVPAAHVYNGQRGNDRLGTHVAVCDLDGDGLQDLVSSAESSEPVSGERSGAIWFWRADALGLPLVAERRHGVRQDGGSWLPIDNGRLGTADLAVGDLDHDGRCDVVADVQSRGWTDGATGSGFVLQFSGDAVEGLSLEPTRVWHTAGDTGVRFGRSLAVGNVDASTGPAGLPDDLLIGASGWDGAGSSYGRALLFTGGPGGTLERTAADATWSLSGVGNNDQVGQGVAIAPDGDLVAFGQGERKVWRIPGGVDHVPGDFLIDALPASALVLEPTVAPDDTLSWASTYVEAVGEGVFLPGRIDRVLPDGSAAFVDVTALTLVTAAGATTTWTVDQPSGDAFGSGLAWFDADGTGGPQLVVAGSEHGQLEHGANAGGVFADDGAWSAIGTAGPTASSNDRRGYRMATGDVDGDGIDDLLVASRSDARPANPTLDVACPSGEQRNNTGHVAVHLGGPGGVGASPDLIWWPPVNGANVNAVESGFDANGDGLDDLIVGTRQNRAVLVYGQAAPPSGEVHELCTQDIWTNAEGGDFGTEVAALGDVDADGCDEVAITSRDEDLGVANRGVVRIAWGYGPTCTRTSPAFTVLARNRANERWGEGVAGGDVTGDGVPDLIVSSQLRSIGADRIGGLVLHDGAELVLLATAPPVGGVVPDAPIHPLAPGGILVESWLPSADFGRSVAILDGNRIAVGMPAAVTGPTGRGGGVAVYPIEDGDLSPTPDWWIAGESFSRVGRFGVRLESAGDRLLIGATGSDANGQNHVGAAYVAPF